ncbi:protein of unknown function DUF1292 [Desulfofarcimen acetoxidans DSM 771]|uniref:UPF0473 protein Dtox_2264 n=1 Tax=Desulfofarcimen acetoxidans (strain ATCC 49208 / DSM 771 / KCTC 5769 / VKM B-1644 / 5575) TaxID=485916 RepID=C8VZV0_DESAS|nr:DUF1292 domain-containing protein [Desulfofarcimen acetoxidans]ACV63078.1 protein of unknown function DUF1292 [Desulfofarcimen acetoxidans DSM 771]
MTEDKRDKELEEEYDEEYVEGNVITLVDDEGKEHDFIEVADIEIEGNEYKILLPAEEDSDEAIIFKCGKDEDGNDVLMDIEDDEEWEKVADAWSEMAEQEE